ncbi:MAG TPA: 4-hydroxythreonine-4-phosphate dehydrogenase PdxA [Chloroflexota bacterium]|nr:4-hydroxythreonine-4-phosphate dehydrogenase PdxA [Chloroflexota bacterium]
MGDPAGVGPEVIVKALQDRTAFEECRPFVVGDAGVLQQALALVGEELEVREVKDLREAGRQQGRIDVLSVEDVNVHDIRPGQLSAQAGLAAVAWVRRGAELALAGRIAGIVTAPINKEAVTLAGVPFTGHTELLAEMAGSRVAMMLATERLRVVHVSTHVSLQEACERVRRARVRETINIAAEGCRRLGIGQPRIAVAGLNPHAGEHGLFGTEDAAEVVPAIADARLAGIDASGPWPPDTIFYEASEGKFDCVVAMYHDQGHIAIKLTDFYGGVNITLGLPFVRTSVDHGTGFAIAGQGIANARSMRTAIKLAAQLAASPA